MLIKNYVVRREKYMKIEISEKIKYIGVDDNSLDLSSTPMWMIIL